MTIRHLYVESTRVLFSILVFIARVISKDDGTPPNILRRDLNLQRYKRLYRVRNIRLILLSAEQHSVDELPQEEC
jgi:hypothetical protein